MADGSVRFVKGTIQSWAMDPIYGGPAFSSGGSGVWQALSTRNGGEVVDGGF